MLNYEVIHVEKRSLAVVSVRTGNMEGDCREKIGALWGRYFSMGGGGAGPCYCVYTNYHMDDESYDAMVGFETEHCPEGFAAAELPEGDYARFRVHGDVRETAAAAWREIWSMPIPRAYTADFEVYGRTDTGGEADIEIYVALAEICQSCGMPMTRPEQHGTECGGGESRDYCVYCRRGGEFTWDCGMEEMIETNLRHAPEMYGDEDRAREAMRRYFPTLKRWRGRAAGS